MTVPPFDRLPLRDLLSRIRRRFPWPPHKGPFGPIGPRDPDPTDEGTIDEQRRRAQVEVIRRRFRESKKQLGEVAIAGPEDVAAEDDGDAVFLYRPGFAVVRDNTDDRRYYDEFAEFFKARTPKFFENEPVRRRETRCGFVLVEMPQRNDGEDPVLATLRELDDDRIARKSDDVLAQPDHVLYVTAKGTFCPATEPEEPRSCDPFPPETGTTTVGEGVRVAVVDTGWWAAAAQHPATPWVHDVSADLEDQEQLVGTTIHEYAGHGTFVAGVIKCLAPGTRVEVEGALPYGGAVFESDICEQLQQALHDDDLPQLVSISAGSYTLRNNGLLGLEIMFAAKGLDDGVKTLVIAAAGNDDDDRPFYPAAYRWAVAVGSVDEDGTRSDFSNYGPWVDVYARGRDLINAFPVGTYTCHYPENFVGGSPDIRTFDGRAQWSGTSFAAPMVAGAVAARMSETNNLTEPRRALDELLAAGPAGPDGIPVVGPLS